MDFRESDICWPPITIASSLKGEGLSFRCFRCFGCFGCFGCAGAGFELQFDVVGCSGARHPPSVSPVAGTAAWLGVAEAARGA